MEILAPKFDAIIVLGGGISPDDDLHPTSVIRADLGKRRIDDEWSDRIIFSGGAIGGELTEAEAMEKRAIEQGLNPAVSLTETFSMSTILNAAHTKELITDPQELHNLAVVTSEWHKRRVRGIFKHVYDIMNPDSPYEVKVIGVPDTIEPRRRYEEPARLAWNKFLLHGTTPGDEKGILHKLEKYYGKGSVGSVVLKELV
ncbi:MAG TPA: YdcF family protein [Patescibacteria group bacterium]|nr:YdcF family protein [Patescibacteria group bacterium]